MRTLVGKNVLIHILLIPFYFFTAKEVALMPVDKLDTLLLFVGLIVIAPITSNFIYNYKNAETKEAINWGHITTFFSMLVIGMLFITLDVLLVEMVGNVLVFRLAIVFFWIAVVTFDFADFLTGLKKLSGR
jgi:phosphatidylglycerophosphate synthase